MSSSTEVQGNRKHTSKKFAESEVCRDPEWSTTTNQWTVTHRPQDQTWIKVVNCPQVEDLEIYNVLKIP